MNAKCFETEQAMSDYQSERELQEALRVQSMAPPDRMLWLQQNWGRLQDGAATFISNMPSSPGASRCYGSMEEKNRFDDQRELTFALQMRSIF